MGHLEAEIAALDDSVAILLLGRIDVELPKNAFHERELTLSLRRTLEEHFVDADTPTKALSNGDTAKTVLSLLALDDEMRAQLKSLMANHPPKSRDLGIVTGVTVVAVALMALQTHIVFERDEKGRWRVRAEKKPTDGSLLRPLVNRLLSNIPKGPFGAS